ncbi:MAG: hypothetical protein CMM46_10810 [Rhodospirillaceae bacterium]|nr:hypothetical protein [Rhodospirillaceae bacterium]|tara:strand:- start:2890 stop:3345 length:456 start_codon:yes stop_codon:yes gene_type:complete
METSALKLKAGDDDDLEVFSAVLQDALMPLSEVTFLDEERRFAALFRRFCYEQEHDAMTGHNLLQVECALVFDGVSSATAWDLGGLGGGDKAELMTIVSEARTESGVSITLVFHGGGHIQIEADSIVGRVADIGEPQMADNRPRHSPVFDL